MSQSLVPRREAHPALSALAFGATKSELARSSLEAIAHAHELFAGAYAGQWQPPKNAIAAWSVVLGDASAEEIAAASLAWLQDTSHEHEKGGLRSKFPPQPMDILALVRAARNEAERRKRDLEAKVASAKRWIERLEEARASGRFEKMGVHERRQLEDYAADSARFLDSIEKRRATGPKPMEPKAAEQRKDVKRGGACGPIASGVAVVALGLSFGLWLAKFRPVRDVRDAAVEQVVATARAAASQLRPDGHVTAILASIPTD